MKGMIGLEIHTYLTTKEKLFCRCIASREKNKANVNVCPTCTGQPGAKPMLPNAEAVRKAVKIALMLNCEVSNRMPWRRKHYDWPDLPKGYQNTLSGAHAVPLGINGKFEGIRISSMHLEEDPASWEPSSGKVDYNRSGLPLVEIVTEPDFTYAEEVMEWLGKLVHALAYLKVADSDAGIKVDVNVNIPKLTDRVEVKNINSIESVGKAIEFELERQTRDGSVRETRRFDEVKGKTMRMRGKEQQEDYRFISDPDLTDLRIDKKFVQELSKEIPELPSAKLARIVRNYKISEKDALVLGKNIDIVDFFEQVAKKISINLALPWVTVELLRVLNWNKTTLDKVDIKPEHFISLLELVEQRKITELQGKQILNKFVPKSFDPSKVEGKISDEKQLRVIIEKILKGNKENVAKYKSGDKNVLNFLMGEVMKATSRRADFAVAKRLLEKLLD
ncbi:MAG: Asp-tRNA(Asn)/Glu-tRNA(Gln) amidotransferase subunit GatB [Nanoarchaeota archaeon]